MDAIETLNAETITDLEPTTTPAPAGNLASRKPSKFKLLAWIALAIFCLFLFTLVKLPSAKIKMYVQGSIASALSQKGIGFTVGEGKIRVGLGLSYVMKDVTLTFPANQEPVVLEEMVVKPALLGLVIGRLGGSVAVTQKLADGTSRLYLQFLNKKDWFSLDFEAKELDLGKLGLLEHFAQLRGTGRVTGEGSFSGDFTQPNSIQGTAALDIKKLSLDAQSFFGFNLPRLVVNEGKLDSKMDAGKLTLKTLTLGKQSPGASLDDLRLNVSGDIQLNRLMDQSALNLTAKLGFSDNVKKAIPLIDTFLGQARQPDGQFLYKLSGTVGAPTPVPMGSGS